MLSKTYPSESPSWYKKRNSFFVCDQNRMGYKCIGLSGFKMSEYEILILHNPNDPVLSTSHSAGMETGKDKVCGEMSTVLTLTTPTSQIII